MTAPPAPARISVDDRSSSELLKDVSTSAGQRLYHNSKERQARLQTKRAQTPEGCTFQPTFQTKLSKVTASKVSTPEGKNRFDRLFEDSKTREMKHEARRLECTEIHAFQPVITAKARRQTTGDSRYEKLYQHAKEIKTKKQEAKDKRDVEGCTFQPVTNLRASNTPTKRKTGTVVGKAVVNATPEKIIAKEQLRREQKIAREMKDCTFQPKLASRRSSPKDKSSSSSSSIHERMKVQEAKKRDKIERLRKKQEAAEAQKNTFRPSINASPAKGCKTPPKDRVVVPVHDRLYASGNKRQVIAERKLKQEDELKKKYSFKPKISTPQKPKPNSTSIFNRLYMEQEKKKIELEKREQQRLVDEMKNCTFQPQIDPVVLPQSTSRAAKGRRGPPAAGPEKAKKPTGTIFDRLYMGKDKKKQEREHWEELRMVDEVKDCTFKPQIEPSIRETPAALDINTETVQTTLTKLPIWDRLNQINKNEIIRKREELRQAEELKECTFVPEITPLQLNDDTHVLNQTRPISENQTQDEETTAKTTALSVKTNAQDTTESNNPVNSQILTESTALNSPTRKASPFHIPNNQSSGPMKNYHENQHQTVRTKNLKIDVVAKESNVDSYNNDKATSPLKNASMIFTDYDHWETCIANEYDDDAFERV